MRPHLASHHVPALLGSEQDQGNSRCSVKCVGETVASKIGFSCPEFHLSCSHRYLRASTKFWPVPTWAVCIILFMSLGKSEALPVSIKEKTEGVSA